MSPISRLRPLGHVMVPAPAIGSLSILLVVGLGVRGMLDRADGWVASAVSQGGAAGYPKALPEWSPWLASVLLAYALTFAMLSVAGTWRRLVLWLTALVLVAAWAPVLFLAARAPEISAPFIAVLWSGVCALAYAANHQMPCDAPPAFRP